MGRINQQTSKRQRKGQNDLWFDLYTLNNHLVPNVVRDNKNKRNQWKYGYDPKYDIVVISKDGTIGDIYTIEGVNIALPKTPKDLKKGPNKWVSNPIDPALKKVKTGRYTSTRKMILMK